MYSAVVSWQGKKGHHFIRNPNRDFDLKYRKVYYFIQSTPNNYVYVTVTSQQRWYWALDYGTLIIKSAFCTVFYTVAKFVLEVCVFANLASVK